MSVIKHVGKTQHHKSLASCGPRSTIVCVLDDMQLEPGDRTARSQVLVELEKRIRSLGVCFSGLRAQLGIQGGG